MHGLAQGVRKRGLKVEIVRAPVRAACTCGCEPLVEVARHTAGSGTGRSAQRYRRASSTAACSNGKSHTLGIGASRLSLDQEPNALTFKNCSIIDHAQPRRTTQRLAVTGPEKAAAVSQSHRREVVTSGLRSRGGRASPPDAMARRGRHPTAAEIHRLSTPRRRFRRLSPPHDHRRRPLRSDQHDHCRRRRRRDLRLHLYPLQSPQRHRGDRDRRAPRGRHARRRCARLDTVRHREVRPGRSFVCSEETLRCSKPRGTRQDPGRPPLPAISAYSADHRLNNVCRSHVHHHGARAAPSSRFRHGRSRGTMPIPLAGDVKHRGLYRTAFGVTLGALVDEIGGGTVPDRRCVPCRSGAAGCLLPTRCSMRRSTPGLRRPDELIGHGGIVIFDDTWTWPRRPVSP